MNPRIEILAEKMFIGKKMKMTFSENYTRQLWQSFMPELKKIEHRIGSELYSIEVFPPAYFDSFDTSAPFEKWAAVEVQISEPIPETMQSMTSPEGLYAVFLHKGPARDGPVTYNYIYNEWIPASRFSLDNRPHFAVMGEGYRYDDPATEEEIWIPIRSKL